jgi:hypothetical protein
LNSSVFLTKKKGRVTTRALPASPKTSLEACYSFSTPHIDITPARFSRSLLLLTRGIRLGAPFLVSRPHLLGPSATLSLRSFGCPVYSLNRHTYLPGLTIFSSVNTIGISGKNFRIIFHLKL